MKKAAMLPTLPPHFSPHIQPKLNSPKGDGNVMSIKNQPTKLYEIMHLTLPNRAASLRIMRITLVQSLLITSLINLSLADDGRAQEFLNQKVSISFVNERLESAIDKLGNASHTRFMYSREVVSSHRKVSYHASNEKLANILDGILSPLHLTYQVMGNQVVIRKNTSPADIVPRSNLPEVQIPNPIDIKVRGKVTDEKDRGLPGVNILIKGSLQGTSTDVDGNFAIDVSSEESRLLFSYVGFQSQEFIVGKNTVINVVLKEDDKTLEEVVVVGYGTVKRKDLTGSVASVSGATLKDIPVTSAAQAIVGRMPGVQVTQTEGSPDAEMKIRVRGGGSITQDNSPLFLVDGFPVSNINDIAPTDIVSIDVLKDASSTAIYGARGANGVVIITTKGGKEGKGKVSYNMFFGQKQITKYFDVLDPYEYVFWQWELQNTNTSFPTRFGDFRDMGLYKQTSGTNWQHEIFGNIGRSFSNNLAISGGNKVTKYNISLTRNDEREVMVGSGFTRHNLTIRTNNQINKWLSVDLNTRLSDLKLKGAGTSSNQLLAHSVQFRPTNGLADFVDPALTEEDFEIANSSVTLNPLKQTLDDYRRQNSLTINLNGAININLPIKNLTYRLEFGRQYGQRTNNRFQGINTATSINTGTQPLASIERYDEDSYRVANLLTYAKTNFLPGSNLNIMVGEELNYQKSKLLTTSVRYLPKYIDAVSALSMMQLGMADPINTSDNASVKVSSFFGRINYDYKGKYLLSGTLRTDGSSKFAPGKQWGYFPSAAVAWRLSDEKFMAGTRAFVDDLKFRLSYGAAGNNRISDNAWRKTLSVKTGRLFIEGNEASPTAFLVPNGVLSNPDLKWETTVTRNAGIDFAILKHRVTGSLELYKNTTKNLLISATIPSSTGYTNQFQNIGQTSNRGVEVSLDAVLVEKGDFRLSASFNIGFNKNRIDRLGDTKRWEQSSGWAGADGPTGDYLIEEGGKVGLIYGYRTAGNGMYSFDDFSYENGTYKLKDGVPNNSALIVTRWFRPGALKFEDQNNDGIVDATNDKVVIGDANPKHTGGFNLTAQFKGLDFSAFFNWVYGNNIYNANKLNFTNYWGGRLYKNLLNEMNSDNRFININRETGLVVNDPTELAAMNTNAKYWSAAMSRAPLHSWVIEDGSFLRLNNLTLGYSFPKDLLSKIKIEQLRIYITGYNLWIWTKYSGYDPEVDSIRSTALTPGMDYNAYPRSRSFNVGLNLTF
jgi:TonB-dependent starch-binding outer membrane protein SusC